MVGILEIGHWINMKERNFKEDYQLVIQAKSNLVAKLYNLTNVTIVPCL